MFRAAQLRHLLQRVLRVRYTSACRKQESSNSSASIQALFHMLTGVAMLFFHPIFRKGFEKVEKGLRNSTTIMI